MYKLYLSLSRYLTVLLLVITTTAWSQRNVTGQVTSQDDGSGIPGVNVVEKGTTNGTVSDIDGNFSINVAENATLVFSFVGFAGQEIAVGNQSSINVAMTPDVTSLDEVVVVGYGTQEKKEITSSVVELDEAEFNKGNINDPTQLLQGKVPGLSVYNRGGDPNRNSTIRLRGISTVGANTEPLVVIDGVIGASLDNVDPNDIESINVLKDGSAAAIYGSRGSSGVILVTTKRGSSRAGGLSTSYNGYVSAATIARTQPIMTPSEYVAAGGNDLGSETDWVDEVTRTGISHVHNIALSGGNESTTFRVSTNFRNVEGILEKSGFDQINARANFTHNTLNNKLKFDLNMALTNRKSDFSFNEALRYGVLFNPTAPIRFDNGDYYQAILFDNFNPVAILNQNVNEGKRKNLNFNAKVDYAILDNLTLTANYGQQYENNLNGEYYSRNSLFRGLNRGGLARRYTSDRSFSLFEGYATYSKSFSKMNMDVSAGYSFQEDQFEDFFLSLGNFPSDELGYYALETSGDRLSGLASLVDINSSRSPNSRIIAYFARVNLGFDNAIFFNASVRREGSTKLGADNQWGVFPAVGLGVDLNRYLDINNVDVLKFRVGYGVTGSLPNETGLAQDQYTYDFQSGGTVTKTRDANRDLKWEQKSEINLGLDFGLGGKLMGALDVYTRDIKDFILERNVDVAVYPSGRRFENAGSLKTNGIELSLNYNAVEFGRVRWNPGIVLSTYKTTLESYINDEEMRADLGAPGQNGTSMIRVAVGEEIGQIWGPVFSGVTTDDASTEANEGGRPVFSDLNGDGQVISNQGSALLPEGDFRELGKGLPSLELGFTNQVTVGNWDFNAFFRGAFGHSLVNTFRAFYEPIDPGAINSYNRVITDKAVDGLTSAQFSSLYVEKADFFKLDNVTVGYNIKNASTSVIRSFRIYANVQNAFVITNYTGIDPEPVLQDYGAIDNGGFLDLSTPDVLAPGLDRRNSYFTARTFTLGVNIGL
ncbi:MAG: SusC/RagA family TonB-linked outer membrane protein [Chryseosolibacter sp.]